MCIGEHFNICVQNVTTTCNQCINVFKDVVTTIVVKFMHTQIEGMGERLNPNPLKSYPL